ncbi:MAG: dihydrofolate reductase [Sphingobacteriales bacterium]|jgi:dihydrofolate reductase
MIVSAIVARGANGEIGKDNQLLWHISEDLKFFKKTTMGCPILMGRKTYESIGRPLPGRPNFVISRNKGLTIPGVQVVESIQAGLDQLQEHPKVFIIGGGSIYKECLDNEVLDELYISEIHSEFEADTFFHWNSTGWVQEKLGGGVDVKSGLKYSFHRWTKSK